MVEQLFEGYSSYIFAYGQTGSGKTFTMQGSRQEDKEGIAPRALRDVFRMASQS